VSSRQNVTLIVPPGFHWFETSKSLYRPSVQC